MSCLLHCVLTFHSAHQTCPHDIFALAQGSHLSISKYQSISRGSGASETRQKACFDEETLKATEKEDLEADNAKHSPKISSGDRILHCAVEQIFVVPVPEKVEQLAEMSKIVSQDRIQQRTVEQTVDVPVPQDVEEPAEFFKASSQDRIEQRFGEQTIEPPAISFAEKIVEMFVTQTREETQQVENTHVQHVINTVEAETPKIIKETAHGKKSVIQEEIKQVAKHIEIPELRLFDEVDDMPVVVQRQVSMVQKIEKIMEVPQMQVREKTVEGPQLQIVEQIVKVPEIQKIQAQTSEILGTAPVVCQVAQAEPVEVVEIGAPLLAESASSLSVTAPVMEIPPVVVESMQLDPVAEYVALAPAVTYAAAAPTVAYGASPATYAVQEASSQPPQEAFFQPPQEIVYKQPASVYEANGSQPVILRRSRMDLPQ